MGATVTAYLAQHDEGWDQVVGALDCPQCHHALRRHSTRWRAAWTHFFRRADERIPILRLYCPQCRATYTLLPDFLTPRHRYQAPIREAVVAAPEAVAPCSAQTRRRWTGVFKALAPTVLHHLASWLLTEARSLSRQESRLLTGAIHGLAGLRQLRALAERAGRSAVASGLFGWLNREFGWELAFIL